MVPITKLFRAILLCGLLVILPAMQSPARAQGISDFLSALSVQQGCGAFRGPAGNAVTVRYYLPDSACPAPAVLILHGIGGVAKYQQDYEEIGKGLAAKGYAAFIVYYFEGSPGLPVPPPDVDEVPDPRSFAAWVETIKGAISYAQSFRAVDPERVALMGLSLGGFVAASEAAHDPRVSSLVVLSGGIHPDYEKGIDSMPPTLIIHGLQDRDVPVREALHLDAILKQGRFPHRTILLPCEGHLPYHRNKDFIRQSVLDFIRQTL